MPLLLAFKGKGEFGHARTPGRYSRFQVTGVVEGLFGFEIFDSEIFWKEILASIFSDSLIQVGNFGGIQNNLKILGSASVSWLPSSVIKGEPHFFEKLYFSCYIFSGKF